MVKNNEMVNRELQVGGRLTLPVHWRQDMGLKIGSELTMKKVDHKIIIEPPIKLTTLRGITKTKKPSKNPKKEAREWMNKQIEMELKK